MKTNPKKMKIRITCKINADSTGVDFSGLDLNHSDFSGLCLERADFSGADLSWVKFNRANLRGANLRGANLTHASFEWCCLSAADLRGVIMEETTMRYSDLSLADVRGTNLDELSYFRDTYVQGLICDASTILTGYEERVAHLKTVITTESYEEFKARKTEEGYAFNRRWSWGYM